MSPITASLRQATGTACTVHGPLFTLKASAVCNVRRKNGIASPTPCASPKRSVVRTVLYANWAVIQRQFSNAPGLTHSLVYLAADAATFEASARIWITSAQCKFLNRSLSSAFFFS